MQVLTTINLNDELPMCRICFENDNQEEMIHPCLCNGTSKYVHRNCLNEWRSLSTNPIANTHCCECHFAYLTLVGNVIEKPICEKLGHYMYTNLFIFFCLVINQDKKLNLKPLYEYYIY